MAKAKASTPTSTKPTVKDLFDGVRLLELNPKGQYLFVINNQQFSAHDVADLISLCDKTAMSNVKGALLVTGDVNTAINVIDIKDLKKNPEGKNADRSTT